MKITQAGSLPKYGGLRVQKIERFWVACLPQGLRLSLLSERDAYILAISGSQQQEQLA